MTTNAELQQRKDKAMARGLGNILPAYADRAENAEIWDVEGKRYIDFAAGIAVSSMGHCNPKITAAVKDQLDKFSHVCLMVTPYESAVRLAEELNEAAPGNDPKKVTFVTTGAEAVENAVKIARAHTGRPGVIAFHGGFHGRTMLALGLTGKNTPYKTLFGPFPGCVAYGQMQGVPTGRFADPPENFEIIAGLVHALQSGCATHRVGQQQASGIRVIPDSNRNPGKGCDKGRFKGISSHARCHVCSASSKTRS